MKDYAKKILNLKVNEFIFLIFIFLMIFYGFESKYISKYFSYIDEIFTIVFIGSAVIKKLFNKNKENKLKKDDKKILLFLFCLMIIGIIGNIISKYQTNYLAVAIDILSYTKFFGVYLAGLINFNIEKSERYYEIAEYFTKFLLIIISIIFIGNQFFDWCKANQYSRYGLPIYTLGGHPTYAAAVCTGCLSILLINPNKNKIWIFIALILIFFTLRMKAIAFVAIMSMLIILKKLDKKFSINILVISVILAIVLARNYIKAYFFTDSASRRMALQGAIMLAKMFFPIGCGFATFGTSASIITYSKAYDITGLNNRYGFRIDASSFVGDGRMGNSDRTIWCNWYCDNDNDYFFYV